MKKFTILATLLVAILLVTGCSEISYPEVEDDAVIVVEDTADAQDMDMNENEEPEMEDEDMEMDNNEALEATDTDDTQEDEGTDDSLEDDTASDVVVDTTTTVTVGAEEENTVDSEDQDA